MDRNSRPPTVEERLGRAWGAVYVGVILVLMVVLFGKGCFFSG
ncbi:MAG: hypothetical protein P1P84_10045 [Deferrisomatales bacterium]|nr:hypothetical protein [Deferrisomatales bacterium]